MLIGVVLGPAQEAETVLTRPLIGILAAHGRFPPTAFVTLMSAPQPQGF